MNSIIFTVEKNNNNTITINGPFNMYPNFSPKNIAILEDSIDGVHITYLPNCTKTDKVRINMMLKGNN